MRRVIAVLIAAGLAIGVVVWWLSPGADSPPSTEAVATTTTSTATTTTTVAMTTTTESETTTTGSADSHVVETVEEAEEILRDLWFGWFEGIYNQDEDRIREVVILEETVETARESFGAEFDKEPEKEDISFTETEILRSDNDCLAVWTEMQLTGFRDGSSGSVHILRVVSGEWRRLSLWRDKGDLWAADCDSVLQ